MILGFYSIEKSPPLNAWLKGKEKVTLRVVRV